MGTNVNGMGGGYFYGPFSQSIICQTTVFSAGGGIGGGPGAWQPLLNGLPFKARWSIITIGGTTQGGQYFYQIGLGAPVAIWLPTENSGLISQPGFSFYAPAAFTGGEIKTMPFPVSLNPGAVLSVRCFQGTSMPVQAIIFELALFG